MTTETIEQVAAPPVVEAEQSQVAPETQAEQSTTETPVDEGPDEELVSFLKQAGHYSGEAETPAGDSASPTSDAPTLPPEVQKARDDGRAEALRDVEAQQKTAQRQAQIDGVRRSYTERHDRLTATLEEAGATPELRKQILDEFRFHNGQVIELAQEDIRDAQARQAVAYGQQLYTEAQKVLTKTAAEAFAKEPHADLPAFFKDFQAKAREGYLSPAQADKKVVDAVSAYKNDLIAKGVLAAGKGIHVAAGAGTTTSGGKPSYSSKREAANLYAQDKISSAEYRRARDNPNLPEGF